MFPRQIAVLRETCFYETDLNRYGLGLIRGARELGKSPVVPITRPGPALSPPTAFRVEPFL